MTLPDRDRWNQLNPLLDDLLDLDASRRRSRMAELRARDASLADELAELLSAAGQAEAAAFLEGDAEHDNPLPPTLVGRQIGAYVIDAPLGQGATGSVWRARRTDGRFDTAVAIKLLHLSLVGRTGALRFEREGAILARLTHPHIARLLDAGVAAEGQPYLVLELVEGERIDAYCDARRLGIAQRLTLFDDVLAAVAHAHSHLVIHRDIKPTNILVAVDGTVKLLDFGIAKLLQDESAEAPLTAEGHPVLTPQYAAPEQVLGAPVTTATDVYALGVLLYQLLTGRHPTAPDTSSSAEVLRTTLHTEPLRLSSALAARAPVDAEALGGVAAERATTLARLRRQLEGDLENIVACALRKNPAERYQTVAALRDDLRRYRAHEPVSARPDSLAYRLSKLVQRRRGTLVASLLFGLAVLAGIGGTLTQARRAEAQARLAEAQARSAQHERDRAQRELAGAEAVEEFMSFLLTSTAHKPFTVSELLLRGETLARQQFADDPVLRARLQLTLSGLTSELDEEDRTVALLRDAQTAAAGTTDTALKAAIDCAIASDIAAQPDEAQAAAMFDAALKQLAAPGSASRTEHAACLNQRAIRALEAGDAPAAARDSRAALEVLGPPHPGQRSLALAIRMNLAGALARGGDIAGAIADLQRAIDELAAMGRGQTIGAATFHNNLGVLLSHAGNPLGALASAQKAARIYGDPLTEPSMPVPLLTTLSEQLLATGQSAEASALFQRGQVLAANRGDARTPAYAVAGFSFCPAGQAARCDRRLAAARRTLADFLPAQHRVFGVLDTTAADLALARGQPREAHVALARALATFDAAPTAQPQRVRAAALMARTELALGQVDAAAVRAAEAVTQAREMARRFEHSAWLGQALVAQGLAQRARGDAGAAHDAWQQGLRELQATVGPQAPATVEVARLLGMP